MPTADEPAPPDDDAETHDHTRQSRADDTTHVSTGHNAAAPDSFETIEAGASMLMAEGTGAPRSGGASGERPGTAIGRYMLLRQIGEGGFGSVFLAEQREPVVRRVALKIIKLGMDTRQVIARFEQERQALALMDHPNIAKVLDAGATATGRPFFVMELCAGESITQYCDRNSLSIHDRLALFVQVCQAVQHAHQKGLIHRDIKPSNILVSTQDGHPLAKVIDFGIAKATAAKLTDKTLFTAEAQSIGTPQYMSPEQAEGSLDIDTRTDVYALGVLLYELLTGVTPFDPKQLRSAAYSEVHRIIREVDPLSPSSRVSENTDTIASVSASRRTEPRRLSSIIRGELDWIVMKALEKDRRRRYETASGFAADVLRYLAGDPVFAAPPSAAYRFRKFVRRNKGPVFAAGGVAGALVLGLAGTIWQAHAASLERDNARIQAARADERAAAAEIAEAEQRRLAAAEAEQRRETSAQRDRAVAAEADARRRAEEVQKVADFQGRMLAQVDPTEAGLQLAADVRARFDAALSKAEVPDEERARQVEAFVEQWSRVNATDTARDLIDHIILKPAVAAIDAQFPDQLIVAAGLRSVLAERYLDLGLAEPALELERQALADRRCILGEEHSDTLVTMSNVALHLTALGRWSEAEEILRDTLAKSRRLRPPGDHETIETTARLARLLDHRGQFDEALSLHEEVVEWRRAQFGEEHEHTITALSDLATLLERQGKLTEAEPICRAVLAARRRMFGEDHLTTLVSLNNLAGLLQAQNRQEEAAACFREVVEKRRRILGDVHPRTLNAIKNLGTVLGKVGKRKEAEALMRESLENQRRLLGADHPGTLVSLSNLAVFLVDEKRLDEAEPMCRDALERRRRVLGENHKDTMASYNIMGYVLMNQDREAEAEPFVRQTLAICRRVLGPDHPDSFLYAHNLAVLLLNQVDVAALRGPAEHGRSDEQNAAAEAAQNRLTEVEQLLRGVIEDGRRAIGAEHAIVLSAARRLGGTLLEQVRFADARDVLAAVEPAARKAYQGAQQRSLALVIRNLGRAQVGLGEFAAAEPNLIEAQEIFERLDGAAHPNTRYCSEQLIELYQRWHTAEPDRGLDARLTQWQQRLDAAMASTQPTSQPQSPP